jgi:hypothetical protein
MNEAIAPPELAACVDRDDDGPFETFGTMDRHDLELDNSQAFTSASPLTISGFGGPSHTDPDWIDLANIAYATANLVGYSGNTQSKASSSIVLMERG